MQIVIDIPEDAYNYIKANGARIPYYKLTDAIKSGTTLPKGHGRLVDADKLQDYFWNNRSKLFQSKDCIIGIDNAPSIIGADRSEEE